MARSCTRIAAPWHTVAVVLAMAGWTVWNALHAVRLRAGENPRLPLYGSTALFEWILLAFVLWGAPARTVLGPPWHTTKRLLRDIGIAALFWLLSAAVLFGCAQLLRVSNTERAVSFMLPRNAVEIAAWIGLCLTAAICEEGVFRGYLQPQLAALSGSRALGILLSAILFGAGHAYQGFRSSVLITIYGAMFGLLAHWRRSVRPGMIAHAWEDILTGLVLGRLA